MIDLPRNRGDLRADFRANIVLDQIVDLVQADQRAHRLFGEVHCRIDQQLLSQFDDRTIRTTNVPTGPPWVRRPTPPG
jgi:hypothetical protein